MSTSLGLISYPWELVLTQEIRIRYEYEASCAPLLSVPPALPSHLHGTHSYPPLSLSCQAASLIGCKLARDYTVQFSLTSASTLPQKGGSARVHGPRAVRVQVFDIRTFWASCVLASYPQLPP